MSPLQRSLRAVKWALGLSQFTLALLVCVILFLQPAAMLTISAATSLKAGLATRPPDGASESEWDEWNARQRPVRDATNRVAEGAFKVNVVTIGLPVGVLLLVVIVLLYRVKGMLQREV